jgi:hypothetical protein
MWIITTNGFLSIVQNLDSTGPDDALLVRGRVRADLERFADFVAHHGDRPAVVHTPRSDYGYRLTTSREMFASYLTEQVGALNYPNFKDEVAAADPRRARIYARVWEVLRDLHKLGAKETTR